MARVLEVMNQQEIPSRNLKSETRDEVESLLRTIVSKRPTVIPLKSVAEVLPGTKWRLGFSTDSATLGDLPRDAFVELQFFDDKRMDYILSFSKKVVGIKRLIAKSSYTVDSTNINPGLVTFVYEEIVTDVFGFKNLGVGFFGLLKGRANYVETAFMDSRFWIERGYSPDGKEFYNVYVKQLDQAGKLDDSVATKKLPIIFDDNQWD